MPLLQPHPASVTASGKSANNSTTGITSWPDTKLPTPRRIRRLDRATQMSVTSVEHQAHLYTKSRSVDLEERLSAVREAIATSPYTWDDLAADGVREWVEESIVMDDVLLASALESLGDLTIDERPYLGKFTVERIYEILTNAEAAYWRRIYSGPGVRTNPGR